MAKEQPITVEGIIKETLPNAMFKVDVEIGEKTHEVLAHVSGKMRMHYIKIAISARSSAARVWFW